MLNIRFRFSTGPSPNFQIFHGSPILWLMHFRPIFSKFRKNFLKHRRRCPFWELPSQKTLLPSTDTLLASKSSTYPPNFKTVPTPSRPVLKSDPAPTLREGAPRIVFGGLRRAKIFRGAFGAGRKIVKNVLLWQILEKFRY